MITVNPMKQLSKIVLADGTEIETHGQIIHASLDAGNSYGTIQIMIKSSEMKDIIKSQDEINQELIELGIAG